MGMVRDALRSLRAAPLLSAVAILSLAIGIGANTTVFSIANQLLLRRLPVEAPDRLAAVTTDSALRLGFTTGIGWNVTMWERFQPFTAPFDGALAWYAPRVGLGRRGERVPVDAIVATGHFFDVLGLPVAMGRPFNGADDVRGGGPDGPVVVISDRLWRRDFGGAPTVIGRSLGIEGVPFTIVGVLPRSFVGLEPGKVADIVLPLATESLYRGSRAVVDQPRAFLLSVMLRLRAGQSFDVATQLLRTAQPEIQRTLDLPAFARERVTLVSAAAGVETPASARPKYARALVILQAVTGLVLLVACANIAYLLLDRWTARTREFQVRIALGATRRALAWPVFIDSAMLATAGGLAGVVFAAWAGPVLTRQLPVSLTVDLDLRVLAFTTAVSVLVAVVCGIGPAVRIVATDPGPVLGTRGAAMRGAWTGRAAAVIVVTQVASSLVIVLTAGLLIVTFNRLSRVPLGYDTSPVVLVDVDYARATDPTASLRRVHDLVELLSREPGVSHAAASLVTPLAAGIQMTATVASSNLPEQDRRVLLNATSPAWFATYGTTLRQGRDFHPLLGLLIGVVASMWSTRALGALLFGVSPTDARMTLAASIVLALAGLFAALVPAARVARIDPAETLRRREE